SFPLAQEVRMWNAGGVAGVKGASITLVFPLGLVCLFLAIMMSRSLTIFLCGDEIAIGLGQNAPFIKFIGTVLVLLLTGSA
ncbi:iron chelate uptake ABC transporter family permease subunit, partial [Bacillus tropicus]|uniref:iron chelate uptake ABC transporter family permease subunit n=1 Tax=Bacillus tropicus TaxID=2026188 RepID=UPI00284390B1